MLPTPVDPLQTTAVQPVRTKELQGPTSGFPQAQSGADQSRSRKKFLAVLCVLTIAAICIETLSPFDFFRPNGVTWIRGANGIRFAGAGVILSDKPLMTEGADSNDSCSLEILLRPATTDSLRTILSFYTPRNPKQLLVRQLKDGLLISHDFVDIGSGSKTSKFNLDHVFQPGKLILLTMTFGSNGMTIYTDGKQNQVASNFTILQSYLAGQVILGTSPVRYDPWQGEVYGLAVYSKKLTPADVFKDYASWTDGRRADPADLHGAIAWYALTEGGGRKIRSPVAFAPDLEIPKSFEVPHKPFLQSPVEHFVADRYYLHDIVVNILGFVPLGFLLCAYLECTRNRSRPILYAILAGGTLSLFIEVLQAYIPQRDSGMTDVITNTLGTMVGAALAGPAMLWMSTGRKKPNSATV